VQEWVDDVYPKVRACARKKAAEIFWFDEATIRSDDPLHSGRHGINVNRAFCAF
jgi:hypothetical protein